MSMADAECHRVLLHAECELLVSTRAIVCLHCTACYRTCRRVTRKVNSGGTTNALLSNICTPGVEINTSRSVISHQHREADCLLTSYVRLAHSSPEVVSAVAQQACHETAGAGTSYTRPYSLARVLLWRKGPNTPLANYNLTCI